MTRKQWANKIKKFCDDAGTYRPFFDGVIDTLAAILEHRDNAEQQFKENGGETVIIRVNEHGANMAKNPAVSLIIEFNQQALAYWKELGLTSKSWQAMMKEENLSGDKRDPMTDALKGLGL